jgi:hypothetical protein
MGRNAHIVNYSVSNAETTVNKNAAKASDIAVDIRGSIVKDGKSLKGSRITFTLGVLKRGGFSLVQDDDKRTVKVTVTEFDKGRTVKQGAKSADNASALKALGL